MRNIDLLRLEMATLWERDAYGRLRTHPLVALAVADDGRSVRFAPALPSDLREALERVPVGDGVLEEYRRLIGPIGKVEVQGGPSYVFPEALTLRANSDLSITTSEDGFAAHLAAARPEEWWDPDEWEDLLARKLGPWAMGRIGEEIVAICHTPVGKSEGAEAGVWTHPDHRRRGYAALVTAAWANVARGEFQTLFYSTSSENLASQAVARKLGLTPIGMIWRVENVAE